MGSHGQSDIRRSKCHGEWFDLRCIGDEDVIQVREYAIDAFEHIGVGEICNFAGKGQGVVVLGCKTEFPD